VFELSILRKYLVPRKKQLSVTLIAFLSVGVISAVVWLVLLFLSVTEGIEKTWLKKLTSIHAPIRITPTHDYFSSYYYLADTISQQTGYTPRSFAEKLKKPGIDLFDPNTDETPPKFWPAPEKQADGKLRDPVMIAAQLIHGIKQKHSDLETAPFEMSGAVLRLQLNRPSPGGGITQSFLTQASYLSSYPEKISYVQELIVGKQDPKQEQGIVLAKGYYDSGVRLGDRGWIQYQAATAGALQEQRLPVVVSEFYDPGVMSVGNKCILAPDALVHMIRTASPIEHFDKTASMGFCVWHADLTKTKELAREIQQKFMDAGISQYWTVTTYHDYEFSKDLMQQFQSDRYLFTLLGLIVLIVACSNIISFLILLVQDKKREIGILQALGASKKSIAFIFGGCGATIGLLSSLIGISAAFLTLKNLDAIVKFLSFLQGHAAFNAAFYGSSLPSEMSVSALIFVAIITPILSLVAGLIPAWKATRLTPSEILRSE
jgi:lipoprotein-releasing system permease protein